ncbi:MgtC/SapB family protein [Pedobacter sp. SYP-B3415]|uniref:MgtC/SapB family protein n=1 Tax=Pedobacter sp. SYP-B3415 TaxID=2496641 RepID=UPI00101DB4EF|nr:MgtC/SapB family protein [Pedobacter sp. SYP-B3415]
MPVLSFSDLLCRLGLAVLLGAVVGLERERREWAAGLRTHALVCLGASLAMIVSAYGFADVIVYEGIELDPSRVAAQVISGVGFLGAGTILFFKQQIIKGLTTAAGLWGVSAIGLACGGGLFIAAVSATILFLFILVGVSWVEKRFFGKRAQTVLSIETENRESLLDEIRQVLNEAGLVINKISLVPGSGAPDHLQITLGKFSSPEKLVQAGGQISKLPGITKIEW